MTALTTNRTWDAVYGYPPPTPPLGGGERPRLPSAQVGPVTQAIRAMRAADPAFAPYEARIDDKALTQRDKTASRFWLIAGRAFQVCEACL